MKPVVVSRVAQRDIDSAAAWYDHRREGLGAEFLARVEEAMQRIELNPEGYAERYRGLRRAATGQFPYSLWFRVMPDNSLILACLHGRRNPVIALERGAGVIEIRKP